MSNKEFLKKIGIEMKVSRIRKGLSLKEVGELTGLHQSTIGAIENGKKDAHILNYKRIADAVGVEIKNFM